MDRPPRHDEQRRRPDPKSRHERDRSRSRSRSPPPPREDRRNDRRRDRSPYRPPARSNNPAPRGSEYPRGGSTRTSSAEPPRGPAATSSSRPSTTRPAIPPPSSSARPNPRSSARPTPPSQQSIPKTVLMEPLEGEDEEDTLARIMGFKAFKSTKNTKVPGNDKNYGVRKVKKSEYRQYMNRVGGFNRPLSPTRT